MFNSKRLLRLRQFARALIVAACVRCRDSFGECLADVWHLRVLLKPKPKTGKLWRQRLRACMKCPVYVPERKTCGPTGNLGCFCYLPVKALYPDSICWIEERGLPSRWPQISTDPNRKAVEEVHAGQL